MHMVSLGPQTMTERTERLAQVASLYYEQDLTQDEIARRAGTSRSTVSRMIQEAREEGVVEIIVHYPWKTVPELEDGLVVQESALRGAEVDGHGDHRVVMALAVAGCAIPGSTVVRGAEAAEVTYPDFTDHMVSLGARMRRELS